MTATVSNELKKVLVRIPQDRMKNIWMFPIRRDRKNPECPSGAILKGNLAYKISPASAIKRLNGGGNVGIYGLPGGLLFLDLDVEKGKLKASPELLTKIKPSLCVRTRNGGLQYYYLNDGNIPNQVIKENGKEIGELRTDWQYVVSSGSYVEPDDNNSNGDGTYRVINDVPIETFAGLEGYIQTQAVKEKPIKTINKTPEKKRTQATEHTHAIRAAGYVLRRIGRKEAAKRLAELKEHQNVI